jgi:hypothetical protein
MADAKNAAPADAPVKKTRKSSGPRKARAVLTLIGIVEGAPVVHVATYNALALVKAIKEYPDASVVEVTPA